MTHNTPPRFRTTGLTLVAHAADVVAAAARRASTHGDRNRAHDQERDELLREVEQLRGSRERVLAAVATQLGALTRGEEPPPWSEGTDDDAVDAAVDAVLRLAGQLRDREAGIVSAFVSLAQRWQTTAYEMEYLARKVLQRYSDDAESLQDYFRISHAAATQARAARSLVVLAGRRPARQFPEPQPLAKVVQHASAQIVDYARVQVTSDPDVAVVSTLAEQLIHLIAELLSNATRSAPPSTPVTVTFDEVDSGWAITVHDDGHGLGDRMQWAQDRVSGNERVGLHELGATPETGLAVVGEYARRHGFLVRLHGTENGGVRTVTTVPRHLLVPVAPRIDLPVTPAPRQPTATTAPPEPSTQGKHHGLEARLTPAAPSGGQTPSGLPIRVPQRQAPVTPPRTSAPPTAPAPDPDAEGKFMSDYVQGSLPDPAPDTASNTSTSNTPATSDNEEPR